MQYLKRNSLYPLFFFVMILLKPINCLYSKIFMLNIFNIQHFKIIASFKQGLLDGFLLIHSSHTEKMSHQRFLQDP